MGLLQPHPHTEVVAESMSQVPALQEPEERQPDGDNRDWMSNNYHERRASTLQQQPALSTVPESEQAEEAQQLEAEELDDLVVQQSQYEGVSESEADQLEDFLPDDYTAGSGQYQNETGAWSEQGSQAGLADGDGTVTANNDGEHSARARDVQEGATVHAAAHSQHAWSYGSGASVPTSTAGPPDEQGIGPEFAASEQHEEHSVSPFHSRSESQQLNDPDSLNWGAGSSNAEEALG